MAATNITELVLKEASERLAQPSTRAEMIVDIGERWTRAKAISQKIFAESQRVRVEGLSAWNKVQPLYHQSKALVEKSEATADPAVAKVTMQEAGKVSIIRNLLAQRALLFRQQFEVLKYTGAAATNRQKLLETALRTLKQAHASGVVTEAQRQTIKSCVETANALDEVQGAMEAAPLPDLVEPGFSPERNQEITDAMQLDVQTPDTRAPSPLPIPKGEPRYVMPTQPQLSTHPVDVLAFQIGVQGATGRSYPLGSLAAGSTEAVAQRPSVLDVAADGQVPRHPLTNLWGPDRRPRLSATFPMPGLPRGLTHPVEESYPASPMLAPYANIGRNTRTGSFLGGFNHPKAPNPLSYINRGRGGHASSLAGILGEDTNRVSQTSYASGAPSTTPDGSECDWLCQLAKAFGAVGPQVGGALVGAGGATAAKGDVAGGAAMGLVGAGLAFFGNFFGGKSTNPDLPKVVADDTILGLPAPVVYVGGGLLAFGLIYTLVSNNKPSRAATA